MAVPESAQNDMTGTSSSSTTATIIKLPDLPKTIGSYTNESIRSGISPFMHAALLETHRKYTEKRLAAYNPENSVLQLDHDHKMELMKQQKQPHLVCSQLQDFQMQQLNRYVATAARLPTLACFKDNGWMPDSGKVSIVLDCCLCAISSLYRPIVYSMDGWHERNLVKIAQELLP